MYLSLSWADGFSVLKRISQLGSGSFRNMKKKKWAPLKLQVILCKAFPNMPWPPMHSTLDFGYLACARSSAKWSPDKCEQDTKTDALQRVQNENNPANLWVCLGSRQQDMGMALHVIKNCLMSHPSPLQFCVWLTCVVLWQESGPGPSPLASRFGHTLNKHNTLTNNTKKKKPR